MTREDAIYWIKNLAVLSTEKDMPQIEEALNMAIEALADRKTEPQNGYQTFNGTSVYVSRLEDDLQTERPCENCQEFDCYGCDYKKTERSSE